MREKDIKQVYREVIFERGLEYFGSVLIFVTWLEHQ
jgi:hypothetical protein